MNVFHITYEPNHSVLDLHFWGCNFKCRGCYKDYQIYDLGLPGNSVEGLAKRSKAKPPTQFLSLNQILSLTEGYTPKNVFFMGREAALDPELAALARKLHTRFPSYCTLLTNGFKLTDVSDIDEVVFSFKAFSENIHKQYTGVSNRGLLDNFKTYYSSKRNLQAEIAYIPGLVECNEIEALAKSISLIDGELLFRVTSYFAVPGASWPSATRKQIELAAGLARKYLNNVITVDSGSKDLLWQPEVIF